MNEKIIAVSIIVPIYKVQKYLCRCVDSILAQTYQEFELILVDDGSPDNSGAICDEYASKDERIKVIHKENGGLSDARNAGLKIACGEYIAFVDSDDWVVPTFLEWLLKELKESGADICECGIVRTNGASFLPEVANVQRDCYSAEDALKLLIRDDVFHQYVWNKLYRRSVIGDILFPKGKTNEDEFWTYQVFGRAKRVAQIDAPLYCYFQRGDSIMGVGYSYKRLDALEAKLERQRYIEQCFPALTTLAKQDLFGSCVYAGQMTLMHLQGVERKKAIKYITALVKSNRLQKDEFPAGRSAFWTRLASFSFWGTCRLKNLLRRGL